MAEARGVGSTDLGESPPALLAAGYGVCVAESLRGSHLSFAVGLPSRGSRRDRSKHRTSGGAFKATPRRKLAESVVATSDESW